MSRTGPWLLVAAGSASAAGAQTPLDYSLPAPPEPAVRLEIRPGCPPATSSEEIVVCGRREDERYRVEPSERIPAARDRAGGEQLQALAEGPGRCNTIGPNQQCTRGLDILGIAFTIVRAIAQARANRD